METTTYEVQRLIREGEWKKVSTLATDEKTALEYLEFVQNEDRCNQFRLIDIEMEE